MSVFLLWILTSFRRSPPSFSSTFLSFPQLSSVFLSFCFSLFSSVFPSFFPQLSSLFLIFLTFPQFFLFSFPLFFSLFLFLHFSSLFFAFTLFPKETIITFIHSFIWKSKNSFFSSFPSMIVFLSFQEKQKAKRWKQKNAQKYLSNNHATNPPSSALALQPSPFKENLTAMNRFLKEDCIKKWRKRERRNRRKIWRLWGESDVTFTEFVEHVQRTIFPSQCQNYFGHIKVCRK